MKVKGIVLKILPDDLVGQRHQRFIVRSKKNISILVIHNIDIADKVYGLHIGENIEIFGEYQWNSQGGMIHWTHHDPRGQHPSGWIKYQGKVYS